MINDNQQTTQQTASLSSIEKDKSKKELIYSLPNANPVCAKQAWQETSPAKPIFLIANVVPCGLSKVSNRSDCLPGKRSSQWSTLLRHLHKMKPHTIHY